MNAFESCAPVPTDIDVDWCVFIYNKCIISWKVPRAAGATECRCTYPPRRTTDIIALETPRPEPRGKYRKIIANLSFKFSACVCVPPVDNDVTSQGAETICAALWIHRCNVDSIPTLNGIFMRVIECSCDVVAPQEENISGTFYPNAVYKYCHTRFRPAGGFMKKRAAISNSQQQYCAS